MIGQRARAETFADRLLQQGVPLREAPLERIGMAQVRRDRSQPEPVAEARQRAKPGSNTRMACSNPSGEV